MFILNLHLYFEYSHDPDWSDDSRAELNVDLSATEPKLTTFD